MPFWYIGEESPGSNRARQLLTATKGNFRESATETIPPLEPSSGGKGEKRGVRAHYQLMVTWADGKPCLLQGSVLLLEREVAHLRYAFNNPRDPIGNDMTR